MHAKRYGVRPPMELIEPCYEIDKKEYIIRNDQEAEQYKIQRMRATVARSINPRDLVNKYAGKYEKNKERQRIAS